MKLLMMLSVIACAVLLASCTDTAVQDPPFISVKITSPADSARVTDSLLIVKVDVERNCGCSAYVEFRMDSTLVISSFVEPYSAEIDVRRWTGYHRLSARAVVTGRAEGRDTIGVFIDG